MRKAVFLVLHNGLKMVLKCSEKEKILKILAVEAESLFLNCVYSPLYYQDWI